MIYEPVEYYDYEAGYEKETPDNYARFYVRAEHRVPVGPWGDERKIEDVAFYIHEPTGIVTKDPVTFQAWIDSIATRT